MFEKYFNRAYQEIGFPYFVPREESDVNKEYARMMVEQTWIPMIWKARIRDKDTIVTNAFGEAAKRIASHGGLVLEICAGPAGGYMPAVLLLENYQANIMISDLCPTVVNEWYTLFHTIENPPPNVEFATFDVCDMPFLDDSIDVISGYSAIINVEGNREKALHEIYRVLKKGGLFVMGDQVVTKEYYNAMPPHHQAAFMERCPDIFTDFQTELTNIGFESIETRITGEWSNKNDDSNLASFTRNLGTELIFTTYIKYCIK